MAVSAEERRTTINKFLLLYLIADAADKHSKRLTFVKIQQLVFLAQLDMIQHQMEGFSYSFKKTVRGVYSEELQADLCNLKEMGFIEAEKSLLLKLKNLFLKKPAKRQAMGRQIFKR